MASTTNSAFVQIRRTPYQSISVMLLLSMTFFVAYVFSFLLLGAQQLLQFVETRPQVTAFFHQQVAPETMQTISNEMKARPYVSDTIVTTKEQALQYFQSENEKDPLLLELVTADILPASIEVRAKDVASLRTIVEDLAVYKDDIEEVLYQADIVDALEAWAMSLRIVGIAIISILLLASITTMIVVIGMKISVKKHEIKTMKLLGATFGYIFRPFFTEGMVYGFFGSLLGWLFSFVLLLYATPFLVTLLGPIQLLPVPTEVLLIQVGAGVGVGLLLGLISSFFASLRYR